VTLWDVRTGIRRAACWKTREHSAVYAVAFSPDGQTLATVSGLGAIDLWDAATGNEPLRVNDVAYSQCTVTVAFSPDGRTIAAADGTHAIWLWDATGLDDRHTAPRNCEI